MAATGNHHDPLVSSWANILTRCNLRGGGPCEACVLLLMCIPPMAKLHSRWIQRRDEILQRKVHVKPADLEIELSNLGAIAEEYLEIAKKLESQRAECHDRMAYRLPTELMAEIFELCLPDVPSPESLLCAPIQDLNDTFSQQIDWITNVNHNWRNIACRTPRLWNFIFLDFEFSSSPEQLATALTYLNRHFQRSRKLPLTIRLRLNSIPGYQGLQSCQELPSASLQLLEAICSQAYRWKVLCISGPPVTLSNISKYTYQLAEGVVQLSSFDFESHYWKDDRTPYASKSLFTMGSPQAPLPSPTYVCNSSRGIKLTSKSIDCTQLTEFISHSISASDLIQLVAVAPRLSSVECHIPYTARRESDIRPQTSEIHVVHDSIKLFDIDAESAQILAAFTLPSLQDLRCEFEEEHYGALHTFLVRSKCRLKSLYLAAFASEEELTELLRLTRHLEYLRTVREDLSPEFLRYFGETAYRTKGEPAFLPRLQTLRFHADQILSSDESFDWSLLSLVLPTKSKPELRCRPLNQVIVDMYGEQFEFTDEQKQGVVDLIDGGLEVLVYVDGDNDSDEELSSLEPFKQALERLYETDSD